MFGKDTLQYGINLSVEYLSVEIRATPQGFFLSQPVYTEDLLQRWSMADCRPIGSLDAVLIESDAEDEDEEPEAGEAQALQSVRQAQRLVRGPGPTLRTMAAS